MSGLFGGGGGNMAPANPLASTMLSGGKSALDVFGPGVTQKQIDDYNAQYGFDANIADRNKAPGRAGTILTDPGLAAFSGQTKSVL